jgi:23S rRNA (guanosine2251-2'-O)-methyltransferase
MSRRIAFGIQAVRAALARRCVRQLYLAHDIGPKRLGRLAAELERATVPIRRCAPAELLALTGTDKHQGIAAEVEGSPPFGEREAHAYLAQLERPLVLVLDGIQDPRNFGALLRTADGAGVDLVVVARNRNVGLTPAASKVASGAAEAQALAVVGNLARFLGDLSAAGMTVVGTAADGERTLYEADLTGPLALVLGAEGEGMRRLTAERCDLRVRLPMRGVVESLNVAVAAGICLYEAVRQRTRLAPSGSVG